MQISSVSSVNFKGANPYNLEIVDIDKAEDAIDTLRRFDDAFIKTSTAEEDEAPEIKNPLQIGASLAVTAIGLYFLAKKGVKGLSNNVGVLLKQGKIKNLTDKAINKISNLTTNNEKLSKITKSITDSKKLEAIKNFGPIQKATGFIQDSIEKHGATAVASKLAGIAGSAAGTAYIATSDSNDDGISDIAQKGINAYKGAVEKAGIIADMVKVLS